METDEATRPLLEGLFPYLRGTSWRVTSPPTALYNCVAWAAGQDNIWWWPVFPPEVGYFWPAAAPREETVTALILAFSTLGYQAAPDAGLVAGMVKIAVYARGDEPTHAARQLPSGLWTSKLGRFADIEHSLESLTGKEYGSVVQILQRPMLKILEET